MITENTSIDGLKMGGDPEMFAVNPDGEAISSHNIIKTKDGRIEARNSYDAPRIKRDGAALEIELPARYCRDELHQSTHQLLQRTLRAAEKVNPDYTLSFKPVQKLSKDSLEGAPEDIFEFGCDPDWNAHTGMLQHPQLADRRSLLRFTGGHLHLSVQTVTQSQVGRDWPINYNDGLSDRQYDRYGHGTIVVANKDEKLEAYATLALLADYLVALPMVAVLGVAHGEGEGERRRTYGRAGSFRMPKHGFEYRVLSTNGMMLSPVVFYLVYGLWRTLGRVVGHRCVDTYPGIGYDADGRRVYKRPADLVTLNSLKRLLSRFENDICPTATVETVINSHDVPSAEKLTEKLVALFESAGGEVLRVDWSVAKTLPILIEANRRGLVWDSNPMYNWGIEPNVDPKARRYARWVGMGGIASALYGRFDKYFLPQLPVYREHAKAERQAFYDDEVWEHPFPKKASV